MGKSILQLQSISKYYYSDTVVTQALRKVNLEFRLGEFVAITGESGSGKSTLLNIISGLDTFDEGEMYFKGEPTFQFDDQEWEEYRRNQIGFVFQDYSLIGHYTALDNVVAALVIQERDQEEARQLAQGYLEQVGLKDFAEQRASQLSSGQKQRLAIARALAKNTDIIVADEPTGNLDSETGEQVIQLLAELSREKLVIMVTHNQEQAEPYVSRRIRLHDGEVVADVVLGKGEQQKKTFDQEGQQEDGLSRESQQEKGLEKKEEPKGVAEETPEEAEPSSRGKKNIRKKKVTTNTMAAFFARRNIQMQPGRAALFFAFFLITAITSFLFIGELLRYADDRITKEYDSAAFLQQNDTRLVVRYPDNRDLTQEDQERIRSVKYVEEVDLYDYCNDVKYYFQEGRGFEYYYGEQQKVTVAPDPMMNGKGAEAEITYEETRGVRFLAEDQFMHSSSCLTTEDLSAGRLPEARDEVVLYSKDQAILDQYETCFFTADNIWNPGEVYQAQVKVVGLLKEATDQVYFDHRMCQMITVGLDGIGYTMDYYYDSKEMRYLANMILYPVIAEDLEENQIRISKYVMIPSTGYGLIPTDPSKAFAGTSLLHIKQVSDLGDYMDPEEQEDSSMQSTQDMTEDGETEDDQEAADDGVEPTEGLGVDVLTDQLTDQGPDIVEVSPELFRKLYDKNTTQVSAYITSYSKTGKVLRALQEMGYDAVSTYQVSATKYVEDKVFQRLEVIGISVLVLIMLLILQVLLVRSILKIKIKDYQVLQFMGMRLGQMNRITYLEMGIHCIVCVLLTLLLMLGVFAAGIPFLVTMMQYYTLLGVVLFVLYNFLLMTLTVASFNRLLRRHV